MLPEKEKRLKESGWRIGTVAEFLNLSPEEARIVEERLIKHKSSKLYRVRNTAAGIINMCYIYIMTTENFSYVVAGIIAVFTLLIICGSLFNWFGIAF